MELLEQTALITGGTAGIGMASARLLAGAGASVIITGRDPERGVAAAATIDGNVRFIKADLSDIGSVKSLVQQVGNVDILVNNAASFPAAMTVDQEVDAFEKTFDTNVRGVYFLAAGLVPECWSRGAAASSMSPPWLHRRASPAHPRTAPRRPPWSPSPALGQPSSAHRASGSTASRPAPPEPKAWQRNGVRPTRNSAVHFRWDAPARPRRSPMRCCSSPHRARVSSPVRPCTPTAAAAQSEFHDERLIDVENL